MKKNVLIILLGLFVGALLLVSCEPEYPPSVWNPDEEGEPTPLITSVSPPDSTYGGVGTRKIVVIDGNHFNPDIEANFVWFGGQLGQVLEASADQLTVSAPANYQDSLTLKIAVHGAYLFGVYGDSVDGEIDPHPYKLKTPLSQPGMYTKYDNPKGLCVDSEDNLFVTRPGSQGAKLDKITPDGTRMEVGTLMGKTVSNIRIGPNGQVYWGYLKYLLRADSSNLAQADMSQLDVDVVALDFDENEHLYVATKKSIYYVDITDMSATALVQYSDTTFSSLRINYDQVYLTGAYTGDDTTMSPGPFLMKADLDVTNGGLSGDLATVLDFSTTIYADIAINQLDFDTDGGIYIATNNYSVLYSAEPATGSFELLYPDLLGKHMAFRITWDQDQSLYVNTNNANNADLTTVYKVRVFTESAPYYGR